MVVELKRDRASDVVVGQILRYMGWINEHLCTSGQSVKGCIIAQRKDQKLEYALKQVNNINFLNTARLSVGDVNHGSSDRYCNICNNNTFTQTYISE